MRDTRASTTLPPFLPLPVNILAEPETDALAPTLWTSDTSRYDVLLRAETRVQAARGSEEAAVVCHREEGKAYLERKFTLMKMPKYLDRGTDGFHKSCLCSDCIYRTDVYIHIRCHVSTDSVVNVTRGGDWIFRWLASLLSLSLFPNRSSLHVHTPWCCT